eukprot:TRINITY_DN5262_c0_g1_i3.p2 TRINITY_DN5262_c0_g1~~TRINITY_DN5262_c0_g1_i3.p2  ORF type:complete len:203 (-),score=25.62 TRINITY_DN5262_c0_g1_i3:12-620(-)
MYSLSIGELGTSAEHIEAQLQNILEMASIWDAVILIDEADIFLETRAEHDMLRNALVGIFLRKLEHYQGVLFLTSNRVHCFDKAFHSRISVAVRYPKLDASSRVRVWQNLIGSVPDSEFCKEISKPEHIQEFSDAYPLNGRQIRSTIRIAFALARRKGKRLTAELMHYTAGIAHNSELELVSELMATHAVSKATVRDEIQSF